MLMHENIYIKKNSQWYSDALFYCKARLIVITVK